MSKGNVAEVNGPGYGFAATNTEGNVISCDNDVPAQRKASPTKNAWRRSAANRRTF